MMKRVLCVWLPSWPIQRLLADRPELRGCAVILYREGCRAGRQVVARTRLAAQDGVVPGMSVVEATALSTTSLLVPHDPLADHAALECLAQACHQFTPIVGLEEADTVESLLLDITGCSRAFHGEKLLAKRLQDELWQRCLAPRLAIADTLGAAWAVARFGTVSLSERSQRSDSTLIVPAGETLPALRPLPIQALRLDQKTVQLLSDLGIRQVTQLLLLARPSLAARFGPCLLERLDQALGEIEEPVIPHRPEPVFEEPQTFESATDHWPFIESQLRQALVRLTERLARRRYGARRLRCRFDISGQEPLEIGLDLFQPSVSVRHLMELIVLRLERLGLPGTLTSLRVGAPLTGPLEYYQEHLFECDEPHEQPRQLATLIDRLTSRLGRAAVVFARLLPDAQPEHACRYESAVGKWSQNGNGPRVRIQGSMKKRASAQEDNSHPEGCLDRVSVTSGPGELLFTARRQRRPLRLHASPLPVEVTTDPQTGRPSSLRWSECSCAIARLWGPERIATGWWRGCPIRRDYYRVQTTTGQRLWLFRHPSDHRWFLHGYFE